MLSRLLWLKNVNTFELKYVFRNKVNNVAVLTMEEI